MQVSAQNRSHGQRKASCKYRLTRFEKYQFVCQLALTINRHFPDFYGQISQLPDNRKHPRYQVKELIVSGLFMFLFKQKSRNQADCTAKNLDYQDNIRRIFGVNVADMDTVDRYLRFIDNEQLEQVKQNMFRELVKSKTFQKYKYQGQYFMFAIDGSGFQSFDYEPYPECPFKKFKNGNVWTTYVLEVKLVTANGFSISVASEWIENPTDKEFDKQDCEFEALKRVSAKLKNAFPRLPIMLLLDGLYPKEPIFSICKKYGWRYVITLKDKSLKSVQEQISDQIRFKKFKQANHVQANKTHWLKNDYTIFESIEYKGHNLYVIETLFEEKHKTSQQTEQTRFVHITDIELTTGNAHKTSQAGRMRWKIENEGFNNQKNNQYNASHKFSRTNFNAVKNYYQLLQIADMINQLSFKTLQVEKHLQYLGLTVNSLIQDILGYLKGLEFEDTTLITSIFTKKQQMRY